MKTNSYTHVPVYDPNNHFIGVLTESTICYRLAMRINKQHKQFQQIRISDITLEKGPDDYLFVSKNMNIFEVDKLFTAKKQHHRKLGAVFITNHGKEQEKILGLITS
jgi:hypothetical protein